MDGQQNLKNKNAWDDVLDPNEKYKYLEAVEKSILSFQQGLEVRGFKDLATVLHAFRIALDDKRVNHVS